MLGDADPFTGEQSVDFVFNVRLGLHVIRHPPNSLPEFLSSPRRVTNDLERALELAALLDSCRQVPEENTLAAILAAPEVEAACKVHTDKLDLSIAYLRRAHFVTFYSGAVYQDEAHMLTQASGCYFRYTPVQPDVKAPLEGVVPEEVKQPVIEEKEDGAEREEGEQDSFTSDRDAANEPEPQPMSEISEQRPAERVFESRTPSDRYNRFVVQLVAELRRNAGRPTPMLRADDERDAEALSALIDTVSTLSFLAVTLFIIMYHNISQSRACMSQSVEDAVEQQCRREKEDKVRCWYPWCSKLFKNAEFLKKHFTSKHDTFAARLYLIEAEPFMRTRYEAEDIAHRPLPPVECEGPAGLERKAVIEIVRMYAPQRESFPFRRNSTGGDRAPTFQALPGATRGGDARDQRRHTSFQRPDFTESRAPYHQRGDGDSLRVKREREPETAPGESTIARETFVRPAITYMDVDAPKVSVCVIFAVESVVLVVCTAASTISQK